MQNIFTGNLSAWLINGSQVLQKITYGTVAPSSGWTPLGIKDVNGDGRTDCFGTTRIPEKFSLGLLMAPVSSKLCRMAPWLLQPDGYRRD